MSRLLSRLGWLLATVAVSAGTAYAVTSRAEPAAATAQPAAPARATTTLTRQTVEPVLSLTGSVQPGARRGTYDVVAPVEPADQAYRLVARPVAVRAAVHGGPAGWACAYRGLDARPGEPGVALRCAVPPSVRVVTGLVATVAVVLDPPAETDVLPLSAVVGGAQRGQVVVVENGAYRLRDVTLGRADREWVEVTGGLRAGETVLERPTSPDVSAAS